VCRKSIANAAPKAQACAPARPSPTKACPSRRRKSDPFSRHPHRNLRNPTMALSRETRERRGRHGGSHRAFNQFWTPAYRAPYADLHGQRQGASFDTGLAMNRTSTYWNAWLVVMLNILGTVAVHGWCMYDSRIGVNRALIANAFTNSTLVAAFAWVYSTFSIARVF
jgi:hypothetical protein